MTAEPDGAIAAASDPRLARRELVGFFALAFAITWTLTGAFVFFGDRLEPLFGRMTSSSPLFFLAVYGPTLAALLLATRRGGVGGLGRFLRRALRWRVGLGWYLLGLFGYPGIWLGWALIERALGLDGGEPLRLERWYQAYPLVLLSGHLLWDPGALGEELGWRGYALPRLMTLMSARTASLLLGAIWAVWHLPAFHLSGLSQSSIDFGGFLVTVVCFSVLMAWLYVRTGGSALVAGILPHMSINTIGHAGIQMNRWVLIAVTAAVLVFSGPGLRRGAGSAGR